MALTRTQAGNELGARMRGVLTAVGMTTADSTGNLKEPLDDTFRAFGVAFADLSGATIDIAQLDAFLAVGAVFVLRRALAEASGLADVSATTLGASKRQSQVVTNLADRLADAEMRATQYGIADLTPAMGSGVYTIDALEPEEVLS